MSEEKKYSEHREGKPYAPWQPITDVRTLRVLGKAAEEAAELCKALNRAIIQGMDGIDPHTGKTNRQSILEELADVSANQLLVHSFLLTTPEEMKFVVERVQHKADKLLEWQEGLLD